MKEIMVKVGTQVYYEVSTYSGTDGNGPPLILGLVQDFSLANQFAKNKGSFGGDAKVMSISREVVILPDGTRFPLGKQLIFEDDVAAQTVKLVQSAKAKLTPEELAALLGVKLGIRRSTSGPRTL